MKKILFLALLFACTSGWCCTSVIVSGRATSDGRPVMLKHRDTGELNNRIERFTGPRYSFIGLVNSPSEGGEVWTGTNSAGFCIMNTATYDLKDDDVPAERMDKEGILMYEALGLCATLHDFELFLDSHAKPLGCEANFGVIDAHGGAAYYEVDNYKWVKFDVNKIPCGYRVVTNFTETGRPEDRKGVDRYEKASELMLSADISSIGHEWIFNNISRSGSPILRDITSASIVFEGVKEGEDPHHTVMWTLLGYPTSAFYFPVLVGEEDVVPSFLKKTASSINAEVCTNALSWKDKDVIDGCRKVEASVDPRFESFYGKWVEGRKSDSWFYSKYKTFSNKIHGKYLNNCGIR